MQNNRDAEGYYSKLSTGERVSQQKNQASKKAVGNELVHQCCHSHLRLGRERREYGKKSIERAANKFRRPTFNRRPCCLQHAVYVLPR